MSSQLTQPASPPQKSNEAPIMRAHGVRKSFRMGETGVMVLKNVDLTVRPGEFLAIEGRSGSGKSTLLHILGGLDAPDAGSVQYESHDVAALAGTASRLQDVYSFGFFTRVRNVIFVVLHLLLYSPLFRWGRADRQLARIRNTQFGFVFQFYHLLPELNVLENTMLAPMIERSWFRFRASLSELRTRATGILTELGLDHRLKHRPSQLSGGERQRVAIARALMNNPRVLFADEPTGNLDFETGKQIMAVLERLHREKGQTIIMVTHDRTIARMADRVLVLRDGKLERPSDPSGPKPAVATLDYQ